jgi:protein-disulfide isomerase
MRAALARPDGRLLAAGWLLGTLALGAAVAAADATLSYRASGRAASILGAPIAAPPSERPARTPTSTPAESPAASAGETPASGGPGDAVYYQEQARLAQEQARKLQETLDDPQKLDRYFADKAAREYDQAPVQKLDLKDVPFKGPASAPVQVVEYSDFLCPYCRSIAGAFASFVPQAGDRVAVFFKNYPLDAACNPSIKNSIHPGACVLAMGGLCAQDQGKFWPYHDKVFGSELRAPKFEDVVRLGAEAGLEVAALQSCLGADATRKRLSAEIEEAQRVGVQATPTLFINGKKLPRINDFVQTVDKEAQKRGMPPLPAQH